MELKVAVSNEKIAGKFLNVWKLNSTLLFKNNCINLFILVAWVFLLHELSWSYKGSCSNFAEHSTHCSGFAIADHRL